MFRDEIIEAIASASEMRHHDGGILFANRIYNMVQSGKIPGLMLTSCDSQKLMKENLAMRKAIAFATATDL